MLYLVHLAWLGLEITVLVVIGIGCIGSFNSNYRTITTTTAFVFIWNRMYNMVFQTWVVQAI
jgi:hypothetical protein